MKIAVFRQDIGIARFCRIELEINAAGRQLDQLVGLFGIRVDQDELVVTIVA
ncbi:hypothetical protein D3C86_2187990 [compost metagenome]